MWFLDSSKPRSGAALETVLASGESYLESLKGYVGFTAQSSALLQAVQPVVAPHYERIIDDFYARIAEPPGARRAITGGPEQIARLKTTLRGWLDELLRGPHDQGYLQRRARIGRVHVQIGLPQAYMFTAMNRIRVQVAAIIDRALANDPAVREKTLEALHQIADIELAIMLETYREDLEEKTRLSDRLATIGQFAAGIGHELRNPLSVIESSLFLLRQRLSRGGSVSEPAVARHLDKIAAEVRRSTRTINDLLELARNVPPKRRRIVLRTLLDDAITDAHLPAGVDVSLSVADGVAVLDPDQIVRVLTNLMTNASQAMEGAGHLWIDATQVEGETHIRVRDSGPGVSPALRSRIFEALFTTKAKGTGLGLALCRRIAEAHGGSVTLEPSAAGACFLLSLPERREYAFA
jgi:two-component system sensor histidine kinase HydH